MHQPSPTTTLPTPTPPALRTEVLNYALAEGRQRRATHLVRTLRLALFWWLAGVGAAKMLAGVAAWAAVMLMGGPNPMPATVTAQPAFVGGLIVVAIAAGVANKSWQICAVLFIGAVAVAVADLAAPEPDAWAAGMPVAAAFAGALLLLCALVPTRWGRWVSLSLLIIGVGFGVLTVLGLLFFAIVGFRAK